MKHKTMRITERDFLLANRRAARQEDIEAHGRPTTFRSKLQETRKAYNRKKNKKIPNDDE